jgi:hypothetical protein
MTLLASPLFDAAQRVEILLGRPLSRPSPGHGKRRGALAALNGVEQDTGIVALLRLRATAFSSTAMMRSSTPSAGVRRKL